jgi:hypothetical protein
LVSDLNKFGIEIEENIRKLTKLEQDFESLTKPMMFLETYPKILKELSRRTQFEKFMQN